MIVKPQNRTPEHPLGELFSMLAFEQPSWRLQTSILDAFGLRFEYFWYSTWKLFYKKRKSWTMKQKHRKNCGLLTIRTFRTYQNPTKDLPKTCFGATLQTNSDFSLILVIFGLGFGPLWAPCWCSLAPKIPQGCQKMPPEVPLAPLWAPKGRPRYP